jgi:serine/threonine protein kinase/Flp pilus assembly protein TadD
VNAKTGRTCGVCGTSLPEGTQSCPACSSRRPFNPDLLLLALEKDDLADEASSSTDEAGSHTDTIELKASIDDLRFGHYQVLQRDDGQPFELGRGAMGITYKAVDVDLQRPVTLKVINARYLNDESARTRFVREARAAAAVRHTNVATVFHLGKKGENYFYAMEFVPGETLEQILRRVGPLDLKTSLGITSQIAAGLTAIHKQQLVHRDIKPSNIMVHLDGTKIESVKIIDLGLAKPVNEPSAADSVPGSFAGTPQYASPEQFSGLGTDIRSDLYSLGVTLWQMLSGEVPFKGSSSELFYQHQHAPLPIARLTLVPQPAVTLLEVLLEKDPAKRFQTPDDLIAAIAGVKAAVSSGSRISKEKLRTKLPGDIDLLDAPWTGVKPLAWKRRLAIFAGLLVVAGLAVAWFYYERQQASSSPSVDKTAQPEKSIAVLPFESISANADDAYFADGMQDEILNHLAKIAQLKVISRTSVMQYRAGAKRDLRQIANALGVATVLEGVVRRDANRVRITTELIDARNDKTVWADSYDRNLTDIFAIQSEIAEAIARRLTATLTPVEQQMIERKPTENLAAYDLYLRAQELIGNTDLNAINFEKTLLDSIDLLNEAVHLDPNFALAYCVAVRAHDLLYVSYDPSQTRRALADAAIATALHLQPDLPDVHLYYAYHLYFCYRDYERASVHLAMAKLGLPNNTDVVELPAFIDRRQGRFDKAIQGFTAAVRLDPRNANPILDLAYTLYTVRKFGAAAEAYDRLIAIVPDEPAYKIEKELFVTFMQTGDEDGLRKAINQTPTSAAPDRGALSLNLSLALYDRDWARAKQLVEQLQTAGGEDNADFSYAAVPVPAGCYSILLARLQNEELKPEFGQSRDLLSKKSQAAPSNALLLSALAVVDALLKQNEAAVAEGQRAVETLPVSMDALDGPCVLMNLAVVYAWTGQIDQAFKELAISAKTPHGIYYGQLKKSPLWDPLRKDPRFDELLAQLAPGK